MQNSLSDRERATADFWRRPTAAVRGLLGILIALVVGSGAACGAGDGEAGGVRDASSPSDAADRENDTGADTGSMADSQAESSGACSPGCGPSEICCVDQHGHFPRCVAGAECTTPLEPPDAG